MKSSTRLAHFAGLLFGGAQYAQASGIIEYSGISASGNVSLVLGAGPVPNFISMDRHLSPFFVKDSK